MADQTGWRFCDKCHGLFFGPNTDKSRCPGGGTHNASASGQYVMHVEDSATTTQFQGGWRFCHNCAGLFFDGHPTTSRTCPAGGLHDASQSGHYVMEFGEDGPGVQGNWRFCKHCFGLFFSAPGSTGHNIEFQGLCPAQDAIIIHDASASGHYCMPFEQIPPGFIQVGGQWSLTQFNGFVVSLDLVQTGNQFEGSARQGDSNSRSLVGAVTSNHIEFTINWDDVTKGLYVGNVMPSGSLEGFTVDVSHPTASWESNRLFTRLSNTPPTPLGLFMQVGGQWDLTQSNHKLVSLNLVQRGDQLQGFATHDNSDSRSLNGSVSNEHIDFTIEWEDGTMGHYTGDLERSPFSTAQQQPLKGVTVDLSHSVDTNVHWKSNRLFMRP
jgi:hypothetical protein